MKVITNKADQLHGSDTFDDNMNFDMLAYPREMQKMDNTPS